MPSASVIDTLAAISLAEPGNGRHEASIVAVGPGGSVPPMRPAPLMHIPRTEPTARIHWIGAFVDARHPADVFADILAERLDVVVVDARWPESFAAEHIPTAINLPFRSLSEETTADLSREATYVVYCWDESCRASAKVAARLEQLGFRVKELHGGLQAWKKQGYPTERA